MGELGFEYFPSQSMGEGRKGAAGVIRLGNWGGPLGAESGLWVVGIPVFAICTCL